MNVDNVKRNIETVKFKQIKYQYLTIIGANIISYSHGFGVGWLSSVVPALESKNSPLSNYPLTLQDKSWLGGSYPLGAVVGGVLFSVLLKFLGRKSAMMVLAIPNLIFWLVALFSTSYTELIIGRFVGGMTGGGVLVCMPTFVAEIANKQIRGSLGLLGPLSIAVGVLVSYICGAFVQYAFLPYCIMGFPVLFLIIMCIIPETPHTLIRRNKIKESVIQLVISETLQMLRAFMCRFVSSMNKSIYSDEAEQSLRFYYNGNSKVESEYYVKDELDKLQQLIRQKDAESKEHRYSLIVQQESLKKIGIGILLVGVSVCSGIIVVSMYATKLFIESGAKFDPYISAIIVGILQVFGICVSSTLVDRIGRRILFGVSSFGAAVSLILFGIFSFLHKKGVDLSSVDYVPLVCLSFYIFINCVGVRPMPFLYIAEILPYNIRQIGVTICMISMSTFAFLTVFTKPILQETFEQYVVIWMYAGFCILGVFFSIFLMVETKGKNLNKVQGGKFL